MQARRLRSPRRRHRAYAIRPYEVGGFGLGSTRSLMARYTRSEVMGSSNRRAPTASATALAMAAGVGLFESSPMALAWYGPAEPPEATSTVSSTGRSAIV